MNIENIIAIIHSFIHGLVLSYDQPWFIGVLMYLVGWVSTLTLTQTCLAFGAHKKGSGQEGLEGLKLCHLP